MARIFKIIKIIAVFFIFSLLISPFVSLFLKEKAANHAYYRLFYNMIAAKETSACYSKKDKALNLLKYVNRHEFPQGAPNESKPMDSLFFGEGFCDFQARSLNSLLGVLGIKSRYAMLLDKDGISPHTVNEVYLNNKWCVFDTLIGIAYCDRLGNLVSLNEISQNPNLIYHARKLLLWKEYDPSAYAGFCGRYARMFPLPLEPVRSVPTVYQAHPLDYMIDLYFKVFKRWFFNFYQDAYLKLKKENITPEDYKLFILARNYHLGYRYDLAYEYYNQLLNQHPESSWRQDALFFLGVLYFDTGKYREAVQVFDLLIKEYPGKWLRAGYFYQGLSYQKIQDGVKAANAFKNCDVYQLSENDLEAMNIHKQDNKFK